MLTIFKLIRYAYCPIIKQQMDFKNTNPNNFLKNKQLLGWKRLKVNFESVLVLEAWKEQFLQEINQADT